MSDFLDKYKPSMPDVHNNPTAFTETLQISYELLLNLHVQPDPRGSHHHCNPGLLSAVVPWCGDEGEECRVAPFADESLLVPSEFSAKS